MLNLGEITVEVLMAPKEKSRFEEGSSSQGGFYSTIFVNATAHARYRWLRTKVVIGDRGLECKEEPYRHDPQFDEIRQNIITRGGSSF